MALPPHRTVWKLTTRGIGSGKTLIAALLLRHTIGKELAGRANGEEKRVAFFLVRASSTPLGPDYRQRCSLAV